MPDRSPRTRHAKAIEKARHLGEEIQRLTRQHREEVTALTSRIEELEEFEDGTLLQERNDYLAVLEVIASGRSKYSTQAREVLLEWNPQEETKEDDSESSPTMLEQESTSEKS